MMMMCIGFASFAVSFDGWMAVTPSRRILLHRVGLLMYISDYDLDAFLISPMPAACLAHLIVFNLVTLVVVGGRSQWSRRLRPLAW